MTYEKMRSNFRTVSVLGVYALLVRDRDSNPTLISMGETPIAQSFIWDGNRIGIGIGLKIRVLRVRIPRVLPVV